MNKEELAKMIDGREYWFETTKEIRKLAKDNNLVIVYGASDDLIEFDGAIYDECGVYEGGDVFILDGDVNTESGNLITALWCENNIAWQYKTSIPHSKFNIYEDGEIYCIGIVFNLHQLSEDTL